MTLFNCGLALMLPCVGREICMYKCIHNLRQQQLQYCTSLMTDIFSVRFMKLYEPIRLEANFLVHVPQYSLVLVKKTSRSCLVE
jgi:hypothetical protein